MEKTRTEKDTAKKAAQDATTALQRERNALQTRLCIAEAALAAIARETQPALESPELCLDAIHRIATLARQVIGGPVRGSGSRSGARSIPSRLD